MAKQRQRMATDKRRRDDQERRRWEMRQDEGASALKAAKQSKYNPENNPDNPMIVGRRIVFEVLDDLVPIASLPEGLLKYLDQMMSQIGAATATTTNALAKSEAPVTISAVKQVMEQMRKLPSEQAWWLSGESKRVVQVQSVNPETGLVETRDQDRLIRLDNAGRYALQVNLQNGGIVVLQPGERFLVSFESGRMEVESVFPMSQPQREREFRNQFFSELGTDFPTFGGISRSGISPSQREPRRTEGRRDVENCELYYKEKIREIENMWRARVQVLEAALARMERQIVQAMQLSNRPTMTVNSQDGRIAGLGLKPVPDQKPSPAEIHLKNPPRKFREV